MSQITAQPVDVASITLRDRRTLTYSEYGDPPGTPVFYAGLRHDRA